MMRIAALICALAVAGCGPHRLAHAQPSREALAREVLAALARRDHARLGDLALSEEEFKQRVWPALPAARPERNMPWSYVWMDLRQKSDARLLHTLRELGGRPYQLEAVKFASDTTEHGHYRIHRETVLLVRDTGNAEIELRILGSMIEAGGGWKVFSYVADS